MTRTTRSNTDKRPPTLARPWIQGAVLVTVLGMFVLILMGFLTYRETPPIPTKVVTTTGQTVYTGDDITNGQGVFLGNGLMEYGTVYGQGAYLGPDFTAEYLHDSAEIVKAEYEALGMDGAARTVEDYRTNRYDPTTGTLTISVPQAVAFEAMRVYYADMFGTPDQKTGLRPDQITDPEKIKQLTAYFAWTAWTSAAERPGTDYSYTNNWPGEDLVDNKPTADTVLWSALSIVGLLIGVAVLFAVFGRWNNIAWEEKDQSRIVFKEPSTVSLTPMQRATAWFFLVMVLLFLVQTLVGGAAAHYRADLNSFFGFQLEDVFPFNLMRTWHIQLALFWVSTSFLAAGIFLVPMLTRKPDRKGQAPLAYLLLAALFIVVAGSMLGEFLGQRGYFGALWSWLGNQGWEYLDLGKLWQILLTIGMVLWVIILWRGLRRRLASESAANLPWMFFYAALALPVVYALGIIADHSQKYPIADFWRFLVVHLWVEDFLELFTTVMVAVMLVLLGVVREKVALRVIVLDIILYSAGGVIGTAHHWYWTGTPASVLSLGAFFSALEVVPLLFLSIEAWTFIRISGRRPDASKVAFPHKWAVMFLIAVGFWNFLGAGVFGFLINLPIVNYWETGTVLTANHGHAAMMGVYGMLAIAFAVFAFKYFIPAKKWSEKALAISFWSLNIGLAWMVVANLFPVGVMQLWEAVGNGYYAARSMDFVTNGTVAFFEWLRLPGDLLFIIGGVLPLLWMAVRAALSRGNHQPVLTDRDLELFIEDDSSDANAVSGGATPDSARS